MKQSGLRRTFLFLLSLSCIFHLFVSAASKGVVHRPTSRGLLVVRGGGGNGSPDEEPPPVTGKADEIQCYGRVSDDEFRLTPEQIETFHREGCVTIPNVLTAEEVAPLVAVFDRFIRGEIDVPGRDFCDMSKPFGVPYEEFSIVNCMLPTTYYPPLQGNVFERLTAVHGTATLSGI